MAWTPSPTPNSNHTIDRLAAVRGDIAEAVLRYERDAGAVHLVTVTKTFAAEALGPLLAEGQRLFGENRVQEAQGKWPQLKERYPDIELHLIGPLQSNKAEDAVALFDVIETVDRPKIARALKKAEEKLGLSRRYYIQVNTGNEPQKAGVAVVDAADFVKTCRDEIGLLVEGLMCIPPADQVAEPHFALLRQLAEEAGLANLSMGMSSDYDTAIMLGATHVRVGSAILGSRSAP
ncbi:YggS family pyridoxal phosphate-dependent enzyme [Pararhizobium sp. IMCC21322]|uniref:YggS family pyridoxal phosphate-dependent enzyme n=1 Tax=Pararhizobium sp. IMCC21322 TaxID=3067903 RepID=UPI002741ADD1|nr:YggS family pyridoxal phosphate-dependent enzyme [Pararhizobium sp. IMCC21322]